MRGWLPLLLLPGCLINTGLRDERLDALGDDSCDTPSTWYRDADGDGYGVDEETKSACAAPEGFAAEPGDCDDGERQVNPGADERCNGIDDDCDGEVDGPDAVDATTWYVDGDGDGYGRSTGSVTSCAGAPGPDMVTQPGDCDDADAAISPGEDERCNGIDDDCDGAVDEVGAIDGYPVWADADGDGFGDPATESTACDLAAGWIPDDSDCDDTNPAVNPLGSDTALQDGDCDGTHRGVNIADSEVYGLTQEWAGTAVAGAGDVNADGLDDWLVGVPGADTNGYDNGVVWLFLGTGGPPFEAVGHDVAVSFHGEAAGHGIGSALASAGDTNGDGYDDILIGAVTNDGGLGGGWIVPGGPLPLSASIFDMPEFTGEDFGDDAGASVAGPGDLDGDGLTEIVFGAPGESSNGPNAGAAYVVAGGAIPSAEVYLDAAHAKLLGPAGSRAGTAVTGAGDLDGDGWPDLWIGGPNAAGGGAAWLVRGGGTAISGTIDLGSQADLERTGEAAGDDAGASLAGLGDLDGDGYDDSAIGAPGLAYGGGVPGGAYVVLGGTGLASTGGLANAPVKVVGLASGDAAGTSVAGAGDVDADGHDDLLIGAPFRGGTGSAYLILGSPSPASLYELATDGIRVDAESGNDDLGASVAGAGDTNGDGFDDLVLGGPAHDHLGVANTGGAYLIFGQVL